MLKVQGRPILARLLDDFAAFGSRSAVVVRGYQADAVDVQGARFVDNPDYASTGEAHSLSLAEAHLGPGTLVAFGDIVLKRHIIQALLEEASSGITLAVDSALAGTGDPDRVLGDRGDSGRFSFEEVQLRAIGDTVAPAASHGVWIGLMHLGREGAAELVDAIREARNDGTLRTERVSDLLSRVLARGGRVRVVYGRGGWVNVNDLARLVEASGL